MKAKVDYQRGRAAAVLLVVILLAAVGGASWYFLIYQRSPQVAARQFLEALKTKNYEQIYRTCIWTGALASIRSGQDVQRLFEMAQRAGLDVSIDSYQIKQAQVQDNQATVKTTVVRGGRSDEWDVILIKDSQGKWKCDLVSSLLPSLGRMIRIPGLPGLGFGR